jgi:hypothetical protein
LDECIEFSDHVCIKTKGWLVYGKDLKGKFKSRITTVQGDPDSIVGGAFLRGKRASSI